MSKALKFESCGDYVKYFEGNIPLIISVPHGGTLRPDLVPDRTSGVMDEDWWTIDLAHDILQQWPVFFLNKLLAAGHLFTHNLRIPGSSF